MNAENSKLAINADGIRDVLKLMNYVNNFLSALNQLNGIGISMCRDIRVTYWFM